jgi:hypothetical protein
MSSKKWPEYQVWYAMLYRCHNNNCPQYFNYGGRGIQVCERWYNFENFIIDMGRRPYSDYSLDRIDPNGNYEPNNCKWSTKIEQATNRRTSVFLEFNDKKQTIAAWARELNIAESTLRARVDKGWPIEKIITTPNLRKKFQKEKLKRINSGQGKWKDRRSPEYQIWSAMLDRCKNPNNSSYPRYGGRGIKFCSEWLNFKTFIKDMGKRPSADYSLDRIDNNGDYCPQNCKWSNKFDQSQNRRACKLITYNGET